MRKEKYVIFRLISLVLTTAVIMSVCPVTAAAATPTVVSLGCVDDAGDYAFFDSDYCYTSGNPKYTNMTSDTGDNMLECYRLDYTNPKRKNYIYMERTQLDDPCSFDITLTRASFTRNTGKIYSNVLINADIRRTAGGADAQLFALAGGAKYGDNSSTFTAATLKADGTLEFYDGTSYVTGMKKSSWYNYKIALNLAAHTADIYFEGEKIKSDMPIPTAMTRLNVLSFALNSGATGDFYLDNLQVTGLINPYVDGEETPVSVFPAETQVRAYMADKVGFHAYGNLLCKDNVKTVISPAVIYDRDNSELYVDTDTLCRAFDISEITVVKKVVVIPGRTGTLTTQPKTVDGVTYLPLTEFARAVLGKYTYTHKTGVFVVSDINHTIKGDSTWTYQSFRADSSQVTPMNDIDHLNAYLQYERPDAQTLMQDYIKSSGDASFTQHPRLLADADDFAYLRQKAETDELYRNWVHSAITKAQGYLYSAPVTYEFEDAMRAMNPANTMLTRFMYWGYAYNMTGEQKYVERAFEEIEAAAKFPDYNTSHIIDAGTYVMALAIGYDWFYNGFTPEQREYAAKVCHEQALKVLASGMYGRLTSTSAGTNMWGAFRWRSNYNSIIVGGVINAALATAEVDPDYCFEIISLGLRSLEYSLAELMPGGGWNEAPGYWNYAFQFFNYSFATMNTNFDTDYGLTKSMGMENTLTYAIATLGAYGTNNFHDAGVTVGNNSYTAFAYLARHFKNKAAFDMRLSDITSRRAGAGMEDLLYYKPEIYTDDATADTVNYVEGIELFSVRDSMDADESEFFFSTHFGTTSGYHQHTDTSAFVLDMYDIRWADDLGSENYNLQNEQGYGDADLYRKRGEGHNIIVINPAKYGPTSYVDGMPKGATKEQLNNKFIPIARREYNDTQAIVTADMSAAYADVTSMQTGYFVDRAKQTVTMRSEFELTEMSEVYWFMHTSASISIDGDTAYLTKGGKTIKVQISTNSMEHSVLEMAAQPLPTSPQVPSQNANSGYRKLAVKLNTEGYTTLTVKISPEDDEEQVSTRPIAMWQLGNAYEEETTSLIYAADHSTMGAYAVATAQELTGIVGKTADDEVMMFADSGNVMSFDIADAELKKYVMMSANVMTSDADTKLRYSWGNNMINDYPMLELNRWNNVKVVADTESGKAATIVNGEMSQWYSFASSGSVFSIGVDSNGDNTLYIDDIHIETAGEYVPEVYPSLDKVFDISGGYINAEEGMTAQYIARRGELPYVTAYSDSSCQEKLPDDMQLVDGNAVVVGDDENTIMYIVGKVDTASDYNIKWIGSASDSFEGAGYTIARASSSTAYGIGGKQPWDGVWKFEYISNTYTESDAYFQHAFTAAQVDSNVVLTMDIYPTDSMYKFMVATGGHRAISKMVEVSAQQRNRWHRLEYVYDSIAGTASVYLDGVLVETRQNVALYSNIIRFIGYVQDKTTANAFYMDNVNIYIGDADLEPVSSDVYTVEFDSITAGSGHTVYDIVRNLDKKFDTYDILVYNETGQVALNRDTVDSSMTVVVKDGSNVVRQYSLK